MIFKKKDKDGLFRSIFAAYFILLLHVVLLAGIGITIILFNGVYHYLPWIMGAIGLLVLSMAWIFYRQLNKRSSNLKEMLSMPQFNNRTVEVKLLGGLATFKLDANQDHPGQLEHRASSDPDMPLIGRSSNEIERKILELTSLYDKNLITEDEFKKAKQSILQG